MTLLPPRSERQVIARSVQFRAHGEALPCVAEIGLYQCTKSEHEAFMQEQENKWRSMGDAEVSKMHLAYFSENKWTPWRYNQVIGWLRIYAYPRKVLGGAAVIAGEYFSIDAKRISRVVSRKRYVWAGEAFDEVFDAEIGSGEVLERTNAAIQSWANSSRLKNYTLDLEVWESIGRHLDLRAMLWPTIEPSSVFQ